MCNARLLVLLAGCFRSCRDLAASASTATSGRSLSDTCFRCHGPDKSSRMVGMRLDIREEALAPRRAGVVPIVPGDPDRSAIVQRIFATDARIMPPASAHKELTAAQKDTIRRWVECAEGAKLRRALGLRAGEAGYGSSCSGILRAIRSTTLLIEGRGSSAGESAAGIA